MSNVDLDAYFRSLGLPTGGEVVVVEVEALRERNAILAEYFAGSEPARTCSSSCCGGWRPI